MSFYAKYTKISIRPTVIKSSELVTDWSCKKWIQKILAKLLMVIKTVQEVY